MHFIKENIFFSLVCEKSHTNMNVIPWDVICRVVRVTAPHAHTCVPTLFLIGCPSTWLFQEKQELTHRKQNVPFKTPNASISCSSLQLSRACKTVIKSLKKNL